MRGVFHFIPMSEGLPVYLSHKLLEHGMTCLAIQYGVYTLISWPYDPLICFKTCLLGNKSSALVEHLSCELQHLSI